MEPPGFWTRGRAAADLFIDAPDDRPGSVGPTPALRLSRRRRRGHRGRLLGRLAPAGILAPGATRGGALPAGVPSGWPLRIDTNSGFRPGGVTSLAARTGATSACGSRRRRETSEADDADDVQPRELQRPGVALFLVEHVNGAIPAVAPTLLVKLSVPYRSQSVYLAVVVLGDARRESGRTRPRRRRRSSWPDSRGRRSRSSESAPPPS